ncbi:hypothetical protein M404DRAFT_995586 [Pisolithus tinctorius Marx 270]|uniref:Uncharacterized protein n=1 Tax=Pisolithus tinctorius Marx 270 TaxID=870435 RepID=A0A0C3KLC9_PISTI|nr:hypothetical protein M404DRAFT_995586 [Pisolithus tinctorius Marx 270]
MPSMISVVGDPPPVSRPRIDSGMSGGRDLVTQESRKFGHPCECVRWPPSWITSVDIETSPLHVSI